MLDQAALGADITGAEGGDAGASTRPVRGRPEAPGEKIDPTRLDIFRDFVNSLDAEGDQSGGAGPSS